MINIDSLKKDFLASVIVFLVAMPLAIGISIACGLPIYCGIISGIIGGIIVGALSGNSLQVSGPAAGNIDCSRYNSHSRNRKTFSDNICCRFNANFIRLFIVGKMV